jgi:hypothetical protein
MANPKKLMAQIDLNFTSPIAAVGAQTREGTKAPCEEDHGEGQRRRHDDLNAIRKRRKPGKLS